MAKAPLRAAALESEAKALTKTQQAAESNRIIQEAREAGLTMPPSQVNPSLVNKGMEGISGAPKVAVRGSIQNQPKINEIIRKDIGLADDVPATRESLAAIRTEASKAYDAVKQVGTITNDAKYFQDLNALTKSYDTAAQSYKGFANPIADVVTNLKETNVQAPAAIEAGLTWSGFVSAADTVKVRVHNNTGGAVDPASASWTVSVHN